MACKGICDRYKRASKKGSNQCYYSPEHPDNKFCSKCQCRMLWPEIKCPCCNFKLRTRPRNYKIVSEPMTTIQTIDYYQEINPLNVIIENTPSADFEILPLIAI